MNVLVTGGSGHLGRDVVRLFKPGGHRPRILSRHAAPSGEAEWVQGDLATGQGIREAVAGVDTIVHAATLSPAAQRGRLRPVDFLRTPSDVDVEGTRRLLAAAEGESVSHLVHVSIVGVERSRLPYMRVKLAAEELVRGGGVPWSIIRATAFYWLLDGFLANMKRMPFWALPRRLEMQPGDSREFAAYVVACAIEGAGGMRREFAGPEVLGIRELARQYQQERQLRRPIVPVPLPAAAARSAGSLPADDPVLGRTTWRQWLRTKGGEQGSGPGP